MENIILLGHWLKKASDEPSRKPVIYCHGVLSHRKKFDCPNGKEKKGLSMMKN
jgi:hypothetical protein